MLESITESFNYPRLRMFPPVAQAERVALQDDVIPLKTPIVATDGKVLDSIRVRKGQVRRFTCLRSERDCSPAVPSNR